MESSDGFERGVRIQLDKEVWSEAGCKEFFQRLNFEPSPHEANGSKVTMMAPVRKLDRKLLHFAATAVTAVFGKGISVLDCGDLFCKINSDGLSHVITTP